MASDIARLRVRETRTKAESRKMVAILQPANRLTETCSLDLWPPSLMLDIHVMVN